MISELYSILKGGSHGNCSQWRRPPRGVAKSPQCVKPTSALTGRREGGNTAGSLRARGGGSATPVGRIVSCLRTRNNCPTGSIASSNDTKHDSKLSDCNHVALFRAYLLPRSFNRQPADTLNQRRRHGLNRGRSSERLNWCRRHGLSMRFEVVTGTGFRDFIAFVTSSKDIAASHTKLSLLASVTTRTSSPRSKFF